MMPTSLRVYSSIIHDAADHFIHDLGNITFANVVHRMLLMSSESQDLRSIQYPYIKRLLVQFASVFIQGVAFSVRDNADGGREIQDPVPIDIVDNMMADIDGGGGGGSGGGGSGGDPDYDAAISNNVGSALIRRSMALAAMGSQRADLALRRATALSRRRQQMQEVHRLLQRAQEEQEQEQEQEQVNASSNENQNSQQQQQNINMVISENQNQNSALNEEEEVEEPNPWGVEF
jgi:hypothetical protein